MAASSSSLLFTVMRKEARLVVPAAELTPPREQKQLSDIDDQGGLRFQIPVIIFYKNNPFMEGKDPVSVIEEALAKALVVYYPFAGRLIERPNGKLVVDCTSEGILFVEADADIELDRLGDMIRPGCPFMEELLHHVPGSDGILGCPLLLVQVTRFRCGGFSFAVRVNHTMSDATGLVQFFKAIAEFVQGKETALSVPPIWQRELLSARQPPRITCRHHEYEQVPNINDGDINTNTFQKSFFFGLKEIRAIRNHLPSHSRSTTFEALTACLWRCRTRALALDPNDTVRVSSLVNGRGLRGLLVPLGYYGNVIAYPAAVSKAGKLCTFSLQYAVELVKMAKAQMSDEEYLRSVADLMVIKGRPSHPVAGTFIVSDLRSIGFDAVDFGWGKPVYGGVAKAVSLISFYMSFKDGIVVPISLPQPVMEKFEEELNKMIEDPLDGSHAQWPSKIKSML